MVDEVTRDSFEEAEMDEFEREIVLAFQQIIARRIELCGDEGLRKCMANGSSARFEASGDKYAGVVEYLCRLKAACPYQDPLYDPNKPFITPSCIRSDATEF